jgi:hypothetical protein
VSRRACTSRVQPTWPGASCGAASPGRRAVIDRVDRSIGARRTGRAASTT